MIIYTEYELISRFLLEIILNGLIFYTVFLVVAQGLFRVETLLEVIRAVTIILSIPIYYLAFSLESVRRIGAADAYLPMAVNHMGHALAVGCMISIYFIIRSYRNNSFLSCIKNIFISIILLVATVLTGSKAAVLSMLIYLFLCFSVGNRFYVRTTFFYVVIFFLSAMVPDSEIGKYSSLKQRFELERFAIGAEQRKVTYMNALESVSDESIILGESWRYEPINTKEPIPYPHNFFLSILLHTGILPFIFFTLFIGSRLIFYFYKMYKSKEKETWILFNSMMYLMLIYVLTSGRITRVMTIFVVLGIIEGYLRRNRSLKSAP